MTEAAQLSSSPCGPFSIQFHMLLKRIHAGSDQRGLIQSACVTQTGHCQHSNQVSFGECPLEQVCKHRSMSRPRHLKQAGCFWRHSWHCLSAPCLHERACQRFRHAAPSVVSEITDWVKSEVCPTAAPAGPLTPSPLRLTSFSSGKSQRKLLPMVLFDTVA